MNEVKEVKGVMIIDEHGELWTKHIFDNIANADWYIHKSLCLETGTFKFVTVTAKIEITGAA